MWSHWICDTLSGERLLPVFPSASRWRSSITGIGDGQHLLQLRDPATRLPRGIVRDISTPWARTLVTCWDDMPQYAGLIRKRKYARFTGVIDLQTVELRALLASRMPFTVPAFDPRGVTEIIGRSLRGVMRTIIDMATRIEPGPNEWTLPIRLPADEAGSESRSWWHYNFETVDQIIAQLESAEGGPQLHLRPQWDASGVLEWEARIGDPLLTGPLIEWDTTASAHGLTELYVTDDAVNQVTGTWAIGAGSEVDMRVGRPPASGLPGTRIPNRDMTRSFKTIAEIEELDRIATGELATFREPSNLTEFGSLASDVLPRAVMGSTLRAWVEDDEFLEDGWLSGSLVGMSGDLSERIGLEVA